MNVDHASLYEFKFLNRRALSYEIADETTNVDATIEKITNFLAQCDLIRSFAPPSINHY